MTELILPPDSFQLGDPARPKTGAPRGFQVAANKSVLRKPPQVRACLSSGMPSVPAPGAAGAPAPAPGPRDKTAPSPSSQGWGRSWSHSAPSSQGWRRSWNHSAQVLEDTWEPDGCCHVFHLLAVSLAISLAISLPILHGGGEGLVCFTQYPAHSRHSAGACALTLK